MLNEILITFTPIALACLLVWLLWKLVLALPEDF